MHKEAIFHQAESNYCYTIDGKDVVIRLKAKRNDISKAVLYYGDRFGRENKTVVEALPMECVLKDDLHDLFECRFTSKYKRVCYYFFLIGYDGEQQYLFSSGFSGSYLYDRQKYFHLPYLHQMDTPNVPEWFYNAVMYQIFPDSFASSEHTISGEKQKIITEDGIELESKLGGELKGIAANLDYLADLGVNCIYLNPIFVANSYHKYDTVDYLKIDPLFGTKEELAGLVDECHKKGIRVILDLVFNQSGSDFFAFRDVITNGRESRYWDWYMIYDFPLISDDGMPNYECFGYYKHMPKFNMDNPEVREYLIGVARYWVEEADIDGYRLDVANEIPKAFWRQFRYELDKVKSSLVYIGEIWHDSDAWLGKSVFHSTMNYNLMYLIWEFFGYSHINASQADSVINSLLMRYRHDLNQAQMNFLDTHDVTRFIDIARFDEGRMMMAYAFLMTFVGVPCIYYGSELALDGSDINESRKKMPWDRVDENKVLPYVNQLIKIRKSHPELIYGSYRTIYADPANDVIAYEREYNGRRLIAVFANNEDAVIRLPLTDFGSSKCTDLLTGETFEINQGYAEISMKGVSARIMA